LYDYLHTQNSIAREEDVLISYLKCNNSLSQTFISMHLLHRKSQISLIVRRKQAHQTPNTLSAVRVIYVKEEYLRWWEWIVNCIFTPNDCLKNVQMSGKSVCVLVQSASSIGEIILSPGHPLLVYRCIHCKVEVECKHTTKLKTLAIGCTDSRSAKSRETR